MMNVFGRKYHLNPVTLRVEEVVLTPKQRLVKWLAIGAGLVLLAIIMRLSYDQFAKTPRYIHYEKENKELREAYSKLYGELKEDEDRLALLKRKDDKLYRSIFGLDPLPSSIREAGTGGSPRYSNLQFISNPDMVIDVFNKMDKLATRAEIQSSSFDYLEQEAIKNRELLARKPSIQPISPADQYWLTSTFGYRSDPFNGRRTAHWGIDLAGAYGLKVHATGEGKVITAEYNRHGYGNEVLIDHGFGYQTRYAHLQKINVKVGDEVKRGQVIGELGSTGRSTGPHLHYEVHYENHVINPLYYFYENLTSVEYDQIAKKATEE